MSVSDVDVLTIKQILEAQKAHIEKLDFYYKLIWEATAWQTTEFLNISGKKVKKNLRIADIISFPWRKKEKVDLSNASDIEDIVKLKWNILTDLN